MSARRCTRCGAFIPSEADHMVAPEFLARLYPVLGLLHEAAGEYDRDALRTTSGEPLLSTAAEFVAWLDFEVRASGGIVNGRHPVR